MSTQFNPTYYLQNNPDVVVAIAQGIFKDAADHYNRFGAKELRNPNAIFDAKYYASRNPDVLNAVAAGVFPSVYAHYLAFGATEGRVPNAAFANFDADRYLTDNADVKAAGITTAAAALKHFVEYGVDEGRPAFDKGGSPVTINNPGNNTGFTLTNGTDIATANVFTSGLVYTPGGNDRINALQDEDVLTGTGTNPTLNATIGNPNDNGAATITPKLNGIETLNFAFTGSAGANTIDLQDATGVKAVNITRITEGQDVTLRNLTTVPANLSISNVNAQANSVNFTYTNAAAAGATDATTLTVTDANVGTVTIQEGVADGTVDQGAETISIVSKGGSNTIGTLVAEDLKTLNITGSSNLTINGQGNAAGSFTTVDASAFTGNLTFRVTQGTLNAIPDGLSNGTVAFKLTSGSGTDSIRLRDQVQSNDSIDGGAGSDTLRFESNGQGSFDVISTNATAQVKNIETVQLWRTGAAVDTAFTFRGGQAEGDQAIQLRNSSNGIVNTTYNLIDLSGTEAQQITINHSGDANNQLVPAAAANALTQNIINTTLKTDTSADTVSVTIAEGINTDPRFNLTLNSAKFENVTIVETDTESNTVKLGNVADHTGTVTLSTTGAGTTGNFLNLDATANIYNRDLSGASAGDKNYLNDVGAGAAERLVASTIDSTALVGDAIVRVSTSSAANGAQTIKLGAGNDTVVFDLINDSRAGLTISDTVTGGAGNDTLAIDGNGTAISIGASELTNVSGFETIRFVGNASTYRLALTDAVVSANGTTKIAIINDNDQTNETTALYQTDVNNGPAAKESALTLDARALSATRTFTYDGEEGVSATADRFIFADANINGTAVINGGDTTANLARNNDVVEVRNTGVVSVGDLVGISNVGSIEFKSDQAVAQSYTLQLNNTVLDAQDTSQAASSTNVETFRVGVIANNETIPSLDTFTLEAGDVTNSFNLEIGAARGLNSIVSGAGNDKLVVLGGYAAGAYAGVDAAGRDLTLESDYNGVGVAGQGTRKVADIINLGAGSDTLITYGAVDLTDATISGAETLEINSNVTLKASQLAAFTSIKSFGAGGHTLTVIDDVTNAADAANTIDLSRFVASGSNLNIVTTSGVSDLTTKGTAAGTAGGSVTVNSGVSTPSATLSVSPASVAEGSALTYTVTLSSAATADTTVNFTTSGTATSGADYTAPASSVVITKGSTTGTITVNTLNDALTTEGTETVIVSLASGTGYSLGGTSSVTGSITDGPAGSTITIPTASTGSVAGTAAADTFTFNLGTAQGTATDTQVSVTGFNTAADRLQISIPAGNTGVAGTTLAQLNGDALANGGAIAVQTNPFTNSTLVTFGLDSDGTAISITLVGVTDPSAVQVTLV